jgi:hypothetical protein
MANDAVARAIPDQHEPSPRASSCSSCSSFISARDRLVQAWRAQAAAKRASAAGADVLTQGVRNAVAATLEACADALAQIGETQAVSDDQR